MGMDKDSQIIPDLRQILRKLTPEQREYVRVRPFCTTETEAAEKVGINRRTISQWKQDTDIELAVSLVQEDGIIMSSEMLRTALPDAANVIIELLGNRKENIRLSAAVEILDRNLGKAVQRQEVEQSGEVKIVIEHARVENNNP